MEYVCIFLVLLPTIAPVLGRSGGTPTTKSESFSVFSFINNWSGGIKNMGGIFGNVKDVLSILLSGDVPYEYIAGDANLHIVQLARKYGYIMEAHEVITEDGYILQIHRIPSRGKETSKRVIFLMHGLLDVSDSWILQGPGYAFAYILADQGYDVWMGNARGNKHSQRHVSLHSDDMLFWEFTWEEIGTYDLPAMIDYTLKVTGEKSLHYVGHSQGTTVFYVMTSLKPEYNKKIKLMFSLSPVAWMSNAKSPLVRMFSPAAKFIGFLLSTFYAYAPGTSSINKIMSYMCTMFLDRCRNSLFLLTGDEHLMNSTLLPVILGHMPSGASIHQFVHYGQLIDSGRFCRFDFGTEKNMELYETSLPPKYYLGAVTAPVSLYYSDNDWLSHPTDVNQLKTRLPNVFDTYLVSNFSHVDFMYASEARDLLYARIMNKIHEFERFTNMKTIM